MSIRRHVMVVVLSCLLPGAQEAGTPAVRAAPPQERHTLSLSEGATREAASLEQLAWLAGAWSGEGLGGQVEEIWSSPRAGSMMGMFRFMQEGQVRFYELMTVAPDAEGRLELRVKHFHQDMTAWEEKAEMVRFPLLKASGTSAWFSGLTIARDGASLQAWLRMGRPDGSSHEVPFRLQRVED